ncbi:MAG: hypothetical protein OXG56_06835 [Gammaproteobacteria bacterium]|nr:hypothetical protein [Gammaproteobacteria bacterium]
MNKKSKQLSNSFSTGGGGVFFETRVQASFVTLMLTGGYIPCLPRWPITEIRLQGKVDGYETDDLVVTVEKAKTNEHRKLLGQIKHSIQITQGNKRFGEVIQAAWNDYNNPDVFTQGKDVIALITGPLSATDTSHVQWLLTRARTTNCADDFFRDVDRAKFSSSKNIKKLNVFRHHLKRANGDAEVPENGLYEFLRHFHLLGYDFDHGREDGVVLSLLHSHISQFQQDQSQNAWNDILVYVQRLNLHAGVITRDNLPEELQDHFKVEKPMSEEYKAVHEVQQTDWNSHPDATHLARVILVGAWNGRYKSDKQILAQLLGMDYSTWEQKVRELLHPDSPFSLRDGLWKVKNRVKLWNQFGSRIIDNDLDTFKSLATTILKESDPAFDLPADQRYAAVLHEKILDHSDALRTGIAEGLAILGTHPETCSNCSRGNAELTSSLAVQDIFADSDWILWGSLNRLLPVLAETAPDEFLGAVENALRQTPCPFDELFAQEGDGITGGNYLTGLFWALEGLAWDEQYLVRVCVILGELARHDPGGQWANRPSNSLITILQPWFPQTTASIEKRKAAVKTLIREWPDVGWNLLIQLLSNQYQASSGSHKPVWRKIIPDDWESNVTKKEYWEQSSYYADLAIDVAGHDAVRLSELIDRFDNLPPSAVDQLIGVLSAPDILKLPETQRRLIWDHLTKFTNRHRRYSHTALPDELVTRIEEASEKLAPTDPFHLYHHLFSDGDSDLYDENGNWDEKVEQLNARRESAIRKIFQQGGIDRVIRFADSVPFPNQVGYALARLPRFDPVFN